MAHIEIYVQWMEYAYCLAHLGTPVIRVMRNVTTVAGEELVLRCYVSGYPVHSITWKKGGLSLASSSYHSSFNVAVLHCSTYKCNIRLYQDA